MNMAFLAITATFQLHFIFAKGSCCGHEGSFSSCSFIRTAGFWVCPDAAASSDVDSGHLVPTRRSQGVSSEIGNDGKNTQKHWPLS
ncbi:hypothetical protein MUCCIDRAFT_155589 [Mucor lusitanicus CBS 277.49]|uniref:Secreted protein n=1 Tax=Mucor lusitanicus CBS 277.49 TaxID=747725 RepID=A0A168M4K1_MUCCL|nr:hypothetical protein MUCCIDRAFT_155589 [Mucor lusitanicus CBS 277.49]